MFDNANDKIDFVPELILTNKQVNLRKAFDNKLSTDINLSKIQLFQMMQSGGFFGRVLGPLLKAGLPLMNNVI